MNPIAITDGTSQPVTAVGAVAPSTGLDISALTGDWELSLEIVDLHCASGGPPRVRVVFEDSVDAFTNSVAVCEANVQGPVVSTASEKLSWLRDVVPSLRLGVTSAKLRVRVVALDGTTPSCTLAAFLWN